MVSPDPRPTIPSSVSTRTTVASKWARGTWSQAAWKGGSSGSRSRRSLMPVIFNSLTFVEGVGRVLAPGNHLAHILRAAVGQRVFDGRPGGGAIGLSDGGLVRCGGIDPHRDQQDEGAGVGRLDELGGDGIEDALRDPELRGPPGDAVERLAAERHLVHDDC